MSRPARRRSYHHGDLRRALVAAATDLLAAHGPQGVTLRGAARRAGVSAAAPYRHFASKEALLAAVAEASFGLLVRDLTAAWRRTRRPPVERLRAVAVAYVGFAAAHPAHYRLMWAPVPRGADHPSLHAAAAGAGDALLAAVAACVEAGRFPAERNVEFLFVIWALLHGLAGLVVDQQLPREVRETVPAEMLAGTAIDVLLTGLLARRHSSRRG